MTSNNESALNKDDYQDFLDLKIPTSKLHRENSAEKDSSGSSGEYSSAFLSEMYSTNSPTIPSTISTTTLSALEPKWLIGIWSQVT